MATHWDLNNREDLQEEPTMYTMAQQGLLRSWELLSGLSTADVYWTGEGCNFDFLRMKTMLTGGDGVIISFEKMGRDQTLFAGDLLAKWYDICGLWNKPKALLFASTHKRTLGEKTWSRQWFRQKVKSSMVMIGLNPDHYSGHSFKAGGATELFVRRVPYHIIKKLGRWESDAAMLYYRVQDYVNKVVGQAFGVAEM